MKRRSFTLIEWVISMGLFAILLSTLFFWYSNLKQKKAYLTKLETPLIEERYATQRLQILFDSMKEPIYTGTDEALYFLFDRGIAGNPILSGTVLGRLYYDRKQHELRLDVLPEPEEDTIVHTPSQTVTLLGHLSSVAFSFYYPPPVYRKPVDPKEIGNPRPNEGWQGSWSKAYTATPSLIKITINGEKKYLFDLAKVIPYPIPLS